MGIGERLQEFEERLLKVWVLLNCETFGYKKEETELLNQIKQSFNSDGWDMHFKDLSLRSELSEAISEFNQKAKIDILKVVSEFKIEREENGGAYVLIHNDGRMVYPVAPKN